MLAESFLKDPTSRTNWTMLMTQFVTVDELKDKTPAALWKHKTLECQMLNCKLTQFA